MPDIRHSPEAPTRTQAMAPGERIDAHHHDNHQVVYAGSGVLAVTTDAGTWFAPGTRAIRVPAGCVHAHRTHEHLALHLLGLPADTNPLRLDAPTVLSVDPLLRELVLACTRAPTTTHRCGWSSTSAFIDVFRRAFGYTPGAHNRRP
ncbi:hypothetical protein [Streptomyces sanglieri]|uniref:hypothetical protein n=1 Tax=Streptomyces sanglieri TaxID=193460 RepID=UPI0035237222